ncbi:hypothetical protein FXF51_16935 [Nonomuraea sp. PA05]|uniref:hypothetical protein n=1 Tax=Nonomuraea sp. PA05 TaxID=2604466 RepID=UPI0011DB94CA|nr:hypothetical protein [Nonomuraea sp. PA05]TYB66778.1 hypothetical protein FXF51_16935 [Nonomuraea sp. PA05]
MAAVDSILAGAFALAGVTLQQAISLSVATLNRRREDRKQSQIDRRELYGRMISQARRVQRILKELSMKNDKSLQEQLSAELDRLSELNAELRLIGSPVAVKAALDLEDEMRRRTVSAELRAALPMPLGPLIEIFRKDLGS